VTDDFARPEDDPLTRLKPIDCDLCTQSPVVKRLVLRAVVGVWPSPGIRPEDYSSSQRRFAIGSFW
jgi:hypothetical protein